MGLNDTHDTQDEDCTHAKLAAVTITSVDKTTVTFVTRSGVKASPDEALLRAFTVARSDIYQGVTTKLPEPPVALVVGAVGPLYLSRAGWQATSDGFGIFDAPKAVYKWPDCAGVTTAICTKLVVVPSSIRLRGHVEGQPELVELELLGHDAMAAQDLRWTGAAYVDLRLTEHGARRLRVTAGSPVKFWPTRVVVQGAPAIDPEVTGEVDVLDSELADLKQHVAFGRHGAPITLSLTQDGINAFHVTLQALAELAGDEAAPRARAANC